MKLLKQVWKSTADFFTVRVCVCVWVLPSPLRAGPLVALATPSPRRAPAARTAGATWWATRLCRAASRSHPETCRLRLRLPRSHLCCSWSLQRERQRERIGWAAATCDQFGRRNSDKTSLALPQPPLAVCGQTVKSLKRVAEALF